MVQAVSLVKRLRSRKSLGRPKESLCIPARVAGRGCQHPYRQAFAIPELRDQLIAYVLNCVPACYAMIEEHSELEADPALVSCSLRDRLRLMVVEGIERIVEENADWVSHHIPSELNPGCAPSNWFG